MKKVLNKNSVWQAALSLIVFITFILLAVGSYGDAKYIESQLGIHVSTELLNDGRTKEIESHPNGLVRTYTGKMDNKERWNGRIEIHYKPKKGMEYTEVVYMEHGVRQGLCTRTYTDGRVEEEHYYNGVKYDIKRASDIGKSGSSSHQVLENKYPWFLRMFNAFEFDSVYMKSYLDTVETLLSNSEFGEAEFDEYYDDVLDELSETPYDSIIALNSILVYFHGLQEMKHDEFRLAVIDHYRSEGSRTYDIVKSTYPNYLLRMNEEKVNDQDFEVFCHDLDDTLASYGPLDPEDPSFVDSVDSRLFISLFSFMQTEETIIALVKQYVKNKDEFSSIHSYINQQVRLHSKSNTPEMKATTSEVAEIVTLYMIFRISYADLIRKAVKESYLTNKGIAFIPEVATVFSAYNSSTSVSLKAYVTEDGGSSITKQGIAWAAYYNPTTSDPTISSDAGTNNFTVTLDGLTEGTTYYARSFATNKAGTAYGNCISFVPSAAAVSIPATELQAFNFTVYPNPASAATTFNFQVEKTENLFISIIDMKGRMVLVYNPGKLVQGKNNVHLDLSDLPNGVYICQLNNNVSTLATQKLVLAH